MIRSLHHVGIVVPDLEIGRAFYELFGLESRSVGNDLVFRCQGRAQDQVRLIHGPKKKLGYASFGTNREGMTNIMQNLHQAGVPLKDPPFDIGYEGIWFQDPHNDWVHIHVVEPASTSPELPPEINAHGRYRRIGQRACDLTTHGKKARPLRLGHLIKFSPDVEKSTAFYTQLLGMKVSDQALDILAFLRGSAGGDHHMLAFAKSSHTGLHHLSFEVSDFDEIAIGAQTLLRAGYKDGFGPGRHIGGSNYFHYIRDPWGSLAEYFWDIDVIPEDADWQPLNVPPEQLTAVWAASPPPEDFVLNFEEPD
ncbi:VOC family protein [Neopusillimonas maritima]|jgi:catechol 2,3-dioxygenase-like lactoylglutathione lyase family enzyme|uniref:Dioxygenase n=1 Tax=Neopusillimonas maritima TaxID=2026239 RepID=A0A3A1YVQ0_9BURK|nr:VOC family protein [Neopusillimonas maritima]RIY42282.1 dioxygenase [Neopusillimonas maritima]